MLIVCFVQSPKALAIALSWDTSSDFSVVGYKLYFGTASRIYTASSDLKTATSCLLSGLVSGTTYYFAVTAYTSTGLESAYSAEVSYHVPSTTAPPSVFLTSPGSGSGFVGPAVINLAATVLANGHTLNKVQFYSGAALLKEVLTSPYSFFWSNVPAGIFGLSAKLVYDGGSSVSSLISTITVTSPPPSMNISLNGLPSPWQSGDIGAVGLTGAASFDTTSSTFTLKGSGSDIWGTADSFRFTWLTASGDCEIRARVGSLQAANGWAKSGVMIRESLNANSPQVSMLLTLSNASCLEYRPSAGANCGVTHGAFYAPPYWVRLVRTGSTITGQVSPDGATWLQIGSPVKVSMNSNVYIGLCSCAGSISSFNTSRFTNVSVAP